ncbi:MAG: glycosyltransferase family 4 protein [Planctomycetaceae bacterium]|jgi:glycosyltransferase involved in cell wall biosynthesis|nr:glycosyltransferase family 4 protein [Planctomycetaceae bacterium]
MKVLHLTASPFFGGPERVIFDIVRSHSEYGFDVESVIATFREGGNCEQFLTESRKYGLSCYVIERDFPNLFGALFDVLRFLRRNKIDLICAHGHKSRFFGLFAARLVGIPIIGVSHGWTWQDWRTSVYERIDQWIHRRMDKVVCVSDGQADKVIKTGTNPKNVVAIHNAIDTERFNATCNWSDDTGKILNELGGEYYRRLVAYFDVAPMILIGAAGRLSPEKGYDVLIDAIKILVDEERTWNLKTENYCNDKYCNENYCNDNYCQNNNADNNIDNNANNNVNDRIKNNVKDCGGLGGGLLFGLVLFGDGFIRAELQNKIDAAGLSCRIKLVGFTAELDYFLPCFDIFVQSSLTEGFPCVNLEAMAAGVPVVATQVGGVPEQINSNYNGILVPPRNPNALATGIKRLIIDPKLRNLLAKNARQNVKTNFTKQKLAKEYFNVFESVIRN